MKSSDWVIPIPCIQDPKYENLLINFRILIYLNINTKTTGFVTDRLGPKKPGGIGANYNE